MLDGRGSARRGECLNEGGEGEGDDRAEGAVPGAAKPLAPPTRFLTLAVTASRHGGGGQPRFGHSRSATRATPGMFLPPANGRGVFA